MPVFIGIEFHPEEQHVNSWFMLEKELLLSLAEYF